MIPEKQKHNSLNNFFRYFLLCFLASCVTTDIKGLTLLEIVNTLFLTFIYRTLIGIWVGLAGMFGIDIYLYLKKNTKNEHEQCSGKSTLFYGNRNRVVGYEK